MACALLTVGNLGGFLEKHEGIEVVLEAGTVQWLVLENEDFCTPKKEIWNFTTLTLFTSGEYSGFDFLTIVVSPTHATTCNLYLLRSFGLLGPSLLPIWSDMWTRTRIWI